VTSSVPEWRRSTDQGPNPRQRKAPTREGNRGSRGGRGRGRGGNGGGPPRKDSTPASQDTPAPPPKVVVDPPATNTPVEPPPIIKPESKPQPTKKNSAAVSEDSTSVSSQTSPRPPHRRRRSQPGRRPSASTNNQNKLLTVQTSSRKASTAPSSPNPAKDLPPQLATPTSPAPVTELKSNLDAFVEHVRARAVATDRPHTPGSHIDWADDDDSLPDLNEWGYTGDVAASAQPEELQTSIPPIFEDTLLEAVIPEVRIEGRGDPTPDETKSQDPRPGPVSNATPPTREVQKIRSKRGGRSRGDPPTQQIPQALNLTESVSQDSTSSPIQPTSATVIPPTNRPQGAKRQNANQGQSPRNNQGRTNPRDNGNGRGRQRGRNGVAVASPKRTSFPAKTGSKVDHTPSAQSQPPAQGPEIGQHVTDPSAQTDPKLAESRRDTVPDKVRKDDKPTETARKTDATDPNPSAAAKNDTPHEPERTHGNVKSNSPRNPRKRDSYNPSHSRSHTFGGQTQSGPQPPDSAPTPNFPHHSSDTNLTPSTSRGSRPPNLGQPPGMRSPGLGPAPKSAGFERHNRNHSSPPGVGGTTRAPTSTRPVLTGVALGLLAKSLGGVPGSPKKEPVPPSDS
jgi:hypothetical protein